MDQRKTCQAPKLTKPAPDEDIPVAYQLPPIFYNGSNR
ncbi:hypothetical protein HDF11_002768 [Tunturiibacter psychrotolerans]